MTLYDQVAHLPLRIDDVALQRREMETSSDFTRVTTVISLSGNGYEGRGEDVTYETAHHDQFIQKGVPFTAPGRYSVDEFSAVVGSTDLFAWENPEQSASYNYRRWAFESAALDLALRQAETDLAQQLDRQYHPVRFVVSTSLGEPPTFGPIETWLEYEPTLEFKLDPTNEWTELLVQRLAETEAVRILDLKGHHADTAVGQDPDPTLYRTVIESFPTALIEDPAVTDEIRAGLEDVASRVSWDYPITGVDSVKSVSLGGERINVKPSRFGNVNALFDTIEFCLDQGIGLYGGGQYELDVGREHLHALASLFYSGSPNDIAPVPYNAPDPRLGLPQSPLSPPTDPNGLAWS